MSFVCVPISGKNSPFETSCSRTSLRTLFVHVIHDTAEMALPLLLLTFAYFWHLTLQNDASDLLENNTMEWIYVGTCYVLTVTVMSQNRHDSRQLGEAKCRDLFSSKKKAKVKQRRHRIKVQEINQGVQTGSFRNRNRKQECFANAKDILAQN